MKHRRRWKELKDSVDLARSINVAGIGKAVSGLTFLLVLFALYYFSNLSVPAIGILSALVYLVVLFICRWRLYR